MENEFKELIKILKKNGMSEDDIKMVRKAWRFTKLAHADQLRLNKEPFASHGLRAAEKLAEWGLDVDSIVAGFLHDTIEEGVAKRKDIVDEFGEKVAKLVDGVTKVSDIKLRASREEEFVENLRKMFFAMAEDLRVVLIKLADRLHNMQTLSALPSEKQKRIARETLEIYAPLAERLGMGAVKAELDDLAFPYVYPDEFKKVKDQSAVHYKKVGEHIKMMKRKILKELAREKIRAKIDTRKKHLYSLWRKLERPEINWEFEKIYDLAALRILVDNVAQCYTALGIVHRLYKPVPHLGVSDFIAQPKPNGYQSIHTKVFGPEKQVVETQIRTNEMHEQAEFGVAAHWHLSSLKAKEKISSKEIDEGKAVVDMQKLSWAKQLAEWQKEISDSKEFLEAVKFDALSSRIFVFSPKGDVFELPVSATPVDYAYAVHTDLANYIKGAKVDGKVVPLSYKLKSGNVCEIMKTKNPREPNRDWLDFVVTNTARKKIDKELRKGNNR